MQEFLQTFSPFNQSTYCIKHLSKCFTGTALRIKDAGTKYGYDNIKTWMQAQIIDLAEYVNVKEKINISQLNFLSENLLAKFSFIKVTEVMVFFYKLKSGDFGVFYGAIDPQVIGKMASEFMQYRQSVLYSIKKKQDTEAAKIRDAEIFSPRDKNLKVSYEEYKELEM